MQSTQLTPRLPRTSVRQNNTNNGSSRIPHQVQQRQNQHSSQIYCNGTQPIGNQIANSKNPLSPSIQNVQPCVQCQESSATTSSETTVNVSQQQQVDDEERRKRYLTFSKDQASSHVRSLKDELFILQQPATNNNNNNSKKLKYHSSAKVAAKTTEQRLKKTPCDQLSQAQQQQQKRQERHFINLRDSQANRSSEHPQITELISDPQPATKSGYTSPPLNTTTKPRPLERLSKLSQQQQHNTARIYPSSRNDAQNEVKSSNQFEFTQSGDEPLATKPNNNDNLNINNKASFRQQPVCEAFIMTGQSMMKLSSNEDDSSNRDTCSKINP